jgi:DNA-binding NarL/FixJ family response regulator
LVFNPGQVKIHRNNQPLATQLPPLPVQLGQGDHEIVRWGLKGVFEHEFSESEIAEAGSAESALKLFYAQDWDIVVLDINLPGRNGLEALSEIKRIRSYIPVLIVSGYPEEEYDIQALKLGAAAYLQKTVAAFELGSAVKKVLSGAKYITPSLAACEIMPYLHPARASHFFASTLPH